MVRGVVAGRGGEDQKQEKWHRPPAWAHRLEAGATFLFIRNLNKKLIAD
jgi:hypothetical protein